MCDVLDNDLNSQSIFKLVVKAPKNMVSNLCCVSIKLNIPD